jgi:drug/metabolite transporter (DMT)-like permease
VPASALAFALGSAVLHAVWNLLLGRARDVQAAAAATFTLAVVIAAPFAVIWWHADTSVWPYALASAIFEAVYVSALAYAYRVTDVSFVYPVTRGLAPVIALVAAVALLGHHASLAEVGGVVLVGVGVVLVRGLRGRSDAQALLLVATIAVSIAAYTLIDRAGIQRAGALTYYLLVTTGPCLVYAPLIGVRAMRKALNREVAIAAVATFGSLMLGLLALRHAAAAPVLAVRSSSIVLATLFARRFVAEHVPWSRVAGSLLVFAGIVLLAT